jgi:hypothetical protein
MKQLRGISNGVDGNNKFTPEKTRVPQRPLASSILSEARRSNAPDGVRFFFVWLELIGILLGRLRKAWQRNCGVSLTTQTFRCCGAHVVVAL